MVTQLSAAERLFVAADFKPPPEISHMEAIGHVRNQVRELANDLRGLNVGIKVNSILRACGYDLITELRSYFNLRIFADLKLIDIGETMATDAAFLRLAKPEFVTAMCSAGVEGLGRLKNSLPPETKVLGVTVPTTWKEEDCRRVHNCSMAEARVKLCNEAREAGLDGVICAPKDARDVRSLVGKRMLIVSPGIRFADQVVTGDDQNADRTGTPEGAIRSCVDILIVGRPIVDATDKRAATEQVLQGILAGLR